MGTITTCPTCDHLPDQHGAILGCLESGCGCKTPRYKMTTRPIGDPTGPTIPARNADPYTSHAATPSPVKAGTQRAMMLAGFLAYTSEGAMSEAAAEAAGVSLSSEYAKRTSELAQAGLVEDTGTTATGVSGMERIVWRITDDGRDVLANLGVATPPKPEKRRTITLVLAALEARDDKPARKGA